MSYEPLDQKAYKHLLNMILNDQLDHNTIYSETRLSKELEVSRTPMRAALNRLTQERYIDVIPNKGFQLHRMTEKDVVETFQIRSAIEGFCTSHIANEYENYGNLFTELEELLQHQRKVISEKGTIEEFFKYDQKFHQLIISSIDNETFNKLFNRYIFTMRTLALSSLRHEGRMEEALEEHTNILKAMKDGDRFSVYPVTLKHMDNPKSINLGDILSK
ncbi:MAG: GntR family transcriptional regulator [Tetragenococcus sp.]|nr:GntR family transcriptional regulator [Tetragenococcus sp.]